MHTITTLTQVFSAIRTRAIAKLGLKEGEVILDLGCGTGLSFELLEQCIGPQGRIIGVELSPDMLTKAREKIARHQWANITLHEVNAEQVDLPPACVDAVLSFYTNDIMASRRALAVKDAMVKELLAIQIDRPAAHLAAQGRQLMCPAIVEINVLLEILMVADADLRLTRGHQDNAIRAIRIQTMGDGMVGSLRV